MVYFLLATATVHRKRKLYIYLTPIAGGLRILYTDSEVHRDRLSVSYGRIPRPVRVPSGTTAHTTKLRDTYLYDSNYKI